MPLPMIVELNRRLVQGYTHFKDDPRVAKLKTSVADYNRQLRLLGIRDHQVEYAKFSFVQVFFTFIYRLLKLFIMSIGTLPGLLLFAPVFVATKVISRKKSQEALAASTVKLQGRDVMATWKLLVALAFAPALYAFYTAVFTFWTYHNRIQGLVPEWVPLWVMVWLGMILFPSITFAALRIGEIGMDILKSLRPLVLSLNPSSANTLVKLRQRRQELAQEVTEVINALGPELFPDFDSARIVADPFREPVHRGDADGERAGDGKPAISVTYQTREELPRNESFHDLASIGFFSTQPPSRNRSRSRSSSISGPSGSTGIHLTPLTQINPHDHHAEVSKRIRGAMRERARERRRRSEDQSWELASSASQTGDEDEDKKTV